MMPWKTVVILAVAVAMSLWAERQTRRCDSWPAAQSHLGFPVTFCRNEAGTVWPKNANGECLAQLHPARCP